MLNKSANSGNLFARRKLADFYRSGMLVDQDYKKAMMYYKLAAKEKDNLSMYYIGYFYYYGHGVEVDKREGIYWMEKAVDNGYIEAKKFLERHNYR